VVSAFDRGERITRRSRWLLRVTAAAIVSVPSTVSAAVDMTGAWWVQASNFAGLSVVENWTQTGTSVSTGTFIGTIDPNTGVFSLTGPSSPPPVCPPNTLNGTASLDNETWTGTALDHEPGSPTLCFAGAAITLAAQRVPSAGQLYGPLVSVRKGEQCLRGLPPYDLQLLVQLSNSSNDVCWSATFDAPDVIRNQSGAFKAKFKTP